jgi:hypothetical protein
VNCGEPREDTMQKGGNDDGGYELDRDELGASLQVRMWGFWSTEVARAFGDAILEEAKAAKKPKTVVLDASNLKPQKEVGQTAIASMLDTLTRAGVTRVSILIASPLTKLQLVRIANERAPRGMVEFVQPPKVA